MNVDLLSDFQDRRLQVEHYLKVVGRSESGLARGAQSAPRIVSNNVLRGGTFLILYNAIEASVRLGVEAIYDGIRAAKVPITDLRSSIRREVIRGFKTRCDPDTHKDMNDVPVEVVAVALAIDAGLPFSGNVDGRKIREVAAVFGFATPTARQLRDGADLLTIKNARNDLAHGLKTYEEVGRNYTHKDLQGLTQRSMGYIEALLMSLEQFIAQEEFKSAPGRL